MTRATLKHSALHALTSWLDGLRLPLPPTLQDWLLPRKHAVVVALLDDLLLLPLPANAAAEKALACPDPETLQARFAEQYNSSQHYPVIELPNTQVLEKKLRLPKSGAGKLASLVRFELERVLPLPLEEVLYNFNVDANRSDPAWLTVTVLVCPRAVLGVLHSASGTLPSSAPGIVARSSSGQWLDMGNNVGQGLRSRYRMPCQPRSAWLLLAVTALFLIAPTLYFQWQWHRIEANALANETRLTALRAALADTSPGAFAANDGYVPPLNLLRELTTLLPAPYWLLSFSVNDGRLQLQGVGPSAAEALAIVEASAYFEKADFLSPVTPSDDASMEAFQILATVRLPHAN